MNLIEDEGARYHMTIIMYLADRPDISDEAVDHAALRPLTSVWMSENLNLPIASTYRALGWLEAAGLIRTHPRKLYLGARPRRVYRITQRGREYAEALREFKTRVEALP